MRTDINSENLSHHNARDKSIGIETDELENQINNESSSPD